MNTTNTFLLAAVTALSLSGAAMAQSEVPSFEQGNFGQRQVAPRIVNEGAGSADVDTRAPKAMQFDYGTLANPG